MNAKKLFLLALTFITLPLASTFLESIYQPDFLKLSGSVYEPERPVFSITGFASGKFQKTAEKYISEKSGLRAIFIRIRNQLHYSIFHKIYAQKTIFGKNNFLFEKDHIEAHLGLDYLGIHEIRNRITHLEKLQSILAKKNIPLLVILAPGKASFYPDLISDDFKVKKKETSNYVEFKENLKNRDIHFIDYISWMQNLKGNDRTIYYPKGGTHWSYYTAALAMPVLQSEISKNLKRKMSEIKLEEEEITSLPYYNLDSDIFNSLNLLWSRPFGKYIRPKISISGDAFSKPNLLIVGDSFYFTLSATGIPEKIFSDKSNFWYYDKTEYSIDGKTTRAVKKLDMQKDIYSRDLVILLVSEVNLKYFGYGFPERVINADVKGQIGE